jgi:N-acetylglucosaminyldiphosphoundecaprenol N-acetyl-beta-D-mannosaminyltransferase
MSDNRRKVNILGCPIDNLSLEEALAAIEKFIESKKPHQYIAINADKIVKMRKDDLFRDIILSSDLNIVDGQPLMWVSRLFGQPVKQRYGGIDIMDALMPLAERKGYGVYFLGGREEIVKNVAEKYRRRCPDLRITGWRNGYWEKEEEEGIIKNIKESGSDVLFFAMSSPKKEVFLKTYLGEIGVPFVMGVGGAFDVLAGKTKRAPEWVQKIGMEWLFRVIQEPRRLWKRYLVGNTIFMWLVLKEFVNLKIFRKNRKKSVNA